MSLALVMALELVTLPMSSSTMVVLSDVTSQLLVRPLAGCKSTSQVQERRLLTPLLALPLLSTKAVETQMMPTTRCTTRGLVEMTS